MFDNFRGQGFETMIIQPFPPNKNYDSKIFFENEKKNSTKFFSNFFSSCKMERKANYEIIAIDSDWSWGKFRPRWSPRASAPTEVNLMHLIGNVISQKLL